MRPLRKTAWQLLISKSLIGITFLDIYPSDLKIYVQTKTKHEPWLVWVSGLSASLRTKGLSVRFPVRAHAWVLGQGPRRGCV